MTDNFERALQERLLARSQVSPREVEALRLFARTLPARRSIWQRPSFQWALSAAAVVLAAVIALPLLFGAPSIGTDPTPQPTVVPTQPAVTPIAPSADPTEPTPTSTPVPSVGGETIRLLTASGSAVDVVLRDLSADSGEDEGPLVRGAHAEQADATMSVRWFDSIIEPVGDREVRVTWVGFARDETVVLEVSRTKTGEIALNFVQAGPPPLSDAEGEDRVLLLDIAEPCIDSCYPLDPSAFVVTFEEPA